MSICVGQLSGWRDKVKSPGVGHFMAVAILFAMIAGCQGSISKLGSSDSGNSSADPYSVASTSAVERPFIASAKPILDAIAARDYAALYGKLSSHVLASTRPEQFVCPTDENHVAAPPAALAFAEEFADWMKKMEEVRGIPVKLISMQIHSADPKILAGQGDAMETMFAIGGMPKEIPSSIRKASVRAQIECRYSESQIKQIAKELNVSEEDVRSGKATDTDEDDDEKPYFNLKFVLVDEGGTLKVGYFEFMPPSMLD